MGLDVGARVPKKQVKRETKTRVAKSAGRLVLVVGATGALGRQVTRQLLEAGFRVRAMTRDPTKAADLTAVGAEVVEGDLTKPTTLDAACKGAYAVVAAAHAIMGRGRNSSSRVDDKGHRDLVDAAKASGAERFVYTSFIHVTPDAPLDFARTKARLEEYVQASGIDYTILRPGAFMEWHAHEFIGKPILDKGKVTILGSGQAPINFVAASDVAKFAVMALSTGAGRNAIVEVGGPANHTRDEVVLMYSKAAGVSPKVSHMGRLPMHLLGTVFRPFHGGLSRVMRASLLEDEHGMPLDGSPAHKEFGIQPMPLREFVAQRVKEHQSAPPAG